LILQLLQFLKAKQLFELNRLCRFHLIPLSRYDVDLLYYTLAADNPALTIVAATKNVSRNPLQKKDSDSYICP
jgi:hypothetical protein